MLWPRRVRLLGLTLALVGLTVGPVHAAPLARDSDSAQTVTVSEQDSGTTVQLTPGMQLTVSLRSTYWQFDDLGDPSILQPLGPPVATPDTSVRIPGTGAGTIAVTLQAIDVGTTAVQASRTVCGEALRCSPGQGSFSLAVVVTP